MTTYSAEVNIYNPEAIADAVDEAGETASTYITEVTGGGIQVHPASNTSDYTQIDANGVKLYKGGVQVAEFGANVNFYDGQGNSASNVVAQFGGSGATIGKSGDMHIDISSSDIEYSDGEVVGATQYVKNLGDMTGDGTDEYMLKSIADTAISSEAAQVVEWDEYGYVQDAPYMYNRMGCAYVTNNDSDGYPDMSMYQWVGSGLYSNIYTLRGAEFISSAAMMTESSEPPNYSTNHTSGYVQLKSNSAWEKPSGHYAPRTELTIEADNMKVDGDGYIYPCAEKMPDFVTEQGTSGIWTYRKWHSGKTEAWVNGLSLGSQTPAVWISPVRYKDLNVSIPSGIFTAAPTVTMTCTTGQWWVVKADATSATNISTRFATVASSAQTITVNVYAIL